MKPKHLLTTSLTSLVLSMSAQAQLTWDTSPTAGIQITAGTWNTVNTNWTSDGGATNISWTNGSAAVFSGNLAASTYIDLSGAISVNNLSRTGTNNLRIRTGTGNTLAISGNVDVATGSYVTLEALGDNQFTGSFAKTGEGLLEINGADSRFAFSSVTLSAGTIGFFGGTGLQSESIALNGGAIGSLTAAGRDLNGAVSIGGNIAIGDDAGSVLSNGVMNFGSSGTVNLGGATRTLTIGSEVNFNGVVSNGGITKEGSGRLTLANVGNTLGGATVINAGELRVSSTAAQTGLLGTLGSGSVTVNSGATLRFFSPSTSNAKSYANDINLSNATLIGEDGIHTLTGKVDLTGANNINVQWSGKNLILEGEVKGTGSFTKGTAASTLILAANNTYGGTTTISGGILQIGNGGTTGTLGGGAVSIGGSGLYINRSNAYTIGNDLSGGGGFQNNGSGTTTLTGNNTRTGSTAINGGILEVASLADAGGVGSAGAVTSEFSFLSIGNTGTLRYTGSGTESTSRNLFMQSAGGTKTIDVANAGGNLTFTSTGGQLSGAIAKTGLGSLTLADNVEGGASVTVNGGKLTLQAANSYSGTTTITSGTLALTGAASTGSSPNLIVDGTLDVSGITAGTFSVGSSRKLSGSGIVNATGKTLSIAGTHAVGGSSSPSQQDVTGGLTYATGSIFEWDLNGNTMTGRGTAYDAVDVTGALTVDSGAIFKIVLGSGVTADPFWTNPAETRTWSDIFSYGSLVGSFSNANIQVTGPGASNIGPGSFTITGTSLTWSAVPEPTSALAGVLIVAGLLRRRRA